MRIAGWELEFRDARLDWRPTRYAGISWLPLAVPPRDGSAGIAEGAATTRDAAVLIRMLPGCGYPAHRHVGIEDVLILQGGYRDERGEHGAGSYLRYEAGSIHSPVALGRSSEPHGGANPACILFAVARDGVELLDAVRDEPSSV